MNNLTVIQQNDVPMDSTLQALAPQFLLWTDVDRQLTSEISQFQPVEKTNQGFHLCAPPPSPQHTTKSSGHNNSQCFASLLLVESSIAFQAVHSTINVMPCLQGVVPYSCRNLSSNPCLGLACRLKQELCDCLAFDLQNQQFLGNFCMQVVVLIYCKYLVHCQITLPHIISNIT